MSLSLPLSKLTLPQFPIHPSKPSLFFNFHKYQCQLINNLPSSYPKRSILSPIVSLSLEPTSRTTLYQSLNSHSLSLMSPASDFTIVLLDTPCWTSSIQPPRPFFFPSHKPHLKLERYCSMVGKMQSVYYGYSGL